MIKFTKDEKRKLFDPSIKGLDKSTKKKIDTLFKNTERFPRRPAEYDIPLYKQLRWGRIPSGGKDAGALLKEFGHTEKPNYPSIIKLSLEERFNGDHYNVPMIYCHWCAILGFDPIHPRSLVTDYSGPEIYPYECFSMRQYKNSIRTKEQFETSYDSEFLEWLMRKVRLELGEKKIFTENEIREYTFNLYDNSCVVCGIKEGLHGDHLKPKSLLWPLTIYNCIPLCRTHNLEKLDKSPDKYFTSKVLEKISKTSNIPIKELINVGYNYEIVDWLVSNKNTVNKWVASRGKTDEYNYILETKITKALKLKPNDIYNL